VTIQALGWWPNGRYQPLADDVASVAYWYQREPHTAIVAVGTTIAGRPPHRSVRARWRIRLLPWMPGGKAGHRIRVQNAGSRNPAVQERVSSLTSSSRTPFLARAATPELTITVCWMPVWRPTGLVFVSEHTFSLPGTNIPHWPHTTA